VGVAGAFLAHSSVHVVACLHPFAVQVYLDCAPVPSPHLIISGSHFLITSSFLPFGNPKLELAGQVGEDIDVVTHLE
jgi:hypothetical protein